VEKNHFENTMRQSARIREKTSIQRKGIILCLSTMKFAPLENLNGNPKKNNRLLLILLDKSSSFVIALNKVRAVLRSAQQLIHGAIQKHRNQRTKRTTAWIN
jgi:hypothetical protein